MGSPLEKTRTPGICRGYESLLGKLDLPLDGAPIVGSLHL